MVQLVHRVLIYQDRFPAWTILGIMYIHGIPAPRKSGGKKRRSFRPKQVLATQVQDQPGLEIIWLQNKNDNIGFDIFTPLHNHHTSLISDVFLLPKEIPQPLANTPSL